MSLLDKVTIVTGSSKGIGFEIAKEFSERSYSNNMFSQFRSIQNGRFKNTRYNTSTQS